MTYFEATINDEVWFDFRIATLCEREREICLAINKNLISQVKSYLTCVKFTCLKEINKKGAKFTYKLFV